MWTFWIISFNFMLIDLLPVFADGQMVFCRNKTEPNEFWSCKPKTKYKFVLINQIWNADLFEVCLRKHMPSCPGLMKAWTLDKPPMRWLTWPAALRRPMTSKQLKNHLSLKCWATLWPMMPWWYWMNTFFSNNCFYNPKSHRRAAVSMRIRMCGRPSRRMGLWKDMPMRLLRSWLWMWAETQWG